MSLSILNSRIKTVMLHALFSVLLLLIALYFVYGIWYPTPLAAAMGVNTLYLIMLGVDLVLGPLLIFIVYKKEKNKLIFDMAVILMIQLSAYGYGLNIIHSGKPAWLVFVKDDIEIVSPINIRNEFITDLKEEHKIIFYKKPMWLVADYGNDPVKRQKFIDDEMFDGISIVTRPETYQPLASKKIEILKELHPIVDLNKINDSDEVAKALQSFDTAIGWLPVKAPELDMVALFDRNAQPLGIVNLRPWN